MFPKSTICRRSCSELARWALTSTRWYRNAVLHFDVNALPVWHRVKLSQLRLDEKLGQPRCSGDARGITCSFSESVYYYYYYWSCCPLLEPPFVSKSLSDGLTSILNCYHQSCSAPHHIWVVASTRERCPWVGCSCGPWTCWSRLSHPSCTIEIMSLFFQNASLICVPRLATVALGNDHIVVI